VLCAIAIGILLRGEIQTFSVRRWGNAVRPPAEADPTRSDQIESQSSSIQEQEHEPVISRRCKTTESTRGHIHSPALLLLLPFDLARQ